MRNGNAGQEISRAQARVGNAPSLLVIPDLIRDLASPVRPERSAARSKGAIPPPFVSSEVERRLRLVIFQRPGFFASNCGCIEPKSHKALLVIWLEYHQTVLLSLGVMPSRAPVDSQIRFAIVVGAGRSLPYTAIPDLSPPEPVTGYAHPQCYMADSSTLIPRRALLPSLPLGGP